MGAVTGCSEHSNEMPDSIYSRTVYLHLLKDFANRVSGVLAVKGDSGDAGGNGFIQHTPVAAFSVQSDIN
jgi:hypothetical protein